MAALATALAWATPVQAREPRGSAAQGLTRGVAAGACQARVLAELRAGEVSAGAGCEVERLAARREVMRRALGGHRFGMLERATVEVGEVSLLLSEALGCRWWPLRQTGQEALGLYDVKSAGCWVRRYNGPLTIAGVLADGRVVGGLGVVEVVEGEATLDLTRLTIQVARRGLGLDAFVRLELGADSWAGSIDLVAARARRADEHAAAVQTGRAVAGLFVVRHPKHAASEQARALALAAMLARQAEDFAAVQRGALAPHRFLERHAWSPYRGPVEALEGAQ